MFGYLSLIIIINIHVYISHIISNTFDPQSQHSLKHTKAIMSQETGSPA